MIDPEQVEADEETAASLRQMAALLGVFWEACKDVGLPDALATAVVRDWHQSVMEEPVAWDDDSR